MPDLAATGAAIADGYIKAVTGVPSRIGEADTVTAFLQAVDDGNYIETAADLAGITKKTIYEWLKRGDTGDEPYKSFRDAVKRAAARAEAAEVQKVRRAGEDPRFWAASMTYLERRHPDRWARRSEDSASPKVIVQIGVKDSDVQVQIHAPSPPLPVEPVSMSQSATIQGEALND